MKEETSRCNPPSAVVQPVLFLLAARQEAGESFDNDVAEQQVLKWNADKKQKAEKDLKCIRIAGAAVCGFSLGWIRLVCVQAVAARTAETLAVVVMADKTFQEWNQT